MEKRKDLKKEGSKLSKEFKNFAFKEATLGAAVGIMLGGAFSDVIRSLVEDILTPPIAYITSGIDFSSMYFIFGEEKYDSLALARESGSVVIAYGNFLNEFISFLITAFILFLIVYQSTKIFNRIKRKEEKKDEKNTKVCEYCRSEIHMDAKVCPFCTSKLS